jgi:hypothetical protein
MLYQQRIDQLNSYSSVLSQFSNAFAKFTTVAADGSPWQKFGNSIAGVLGEISSLISTYAALIAVESVAESIKAGNGIQGVNDYVESVPASSTTAIVLESGRFKNVSGEDKGKVIIMGASADIKLAVIELP